jgi:hypothetical protein
MSCKMDGRCPRKLSSMPEKWCELAVLRLKAIRNAGKELTEEEETLLPGCPWAVDHQLAHYCFFQYLAEFSQEKNISDVELAALLNVSIETIKKIEKSGLSKMREHSSFSSLKTDNQPVVPDSSPEDYKIYR